MRTHSWSAEVREAEFSHDEFHGRVRSLKTWRDFCEAMSRYGQILCMSDQEECLVQMIGPVALKLGLPKRVLTD